jgi:hypothetical protein
MLCDKLRPVIRSKLRGQLSKIVMLLHDNAHTVKNTIAAAVRGTTASTIQSWPCLGGLTFVWNPQKRPSFCQRPRAEGHDAYVTCHTAENIFLWRHTKAGAKLDQVCWKAGGRRRLDNWCTCKLHVLLNVTNVMRNSFGLPTYICILKSLWKPYVLQLIIMGVTVCEETFRSCTKKEYLCSYMSQSVSKALPSEPITAEYNWRQMRIICQCWLPQILYKDASYVYVF